MLSDEYELWTRDGATLAVAGVDDPNGPCGTKTGPELRAEIDADYTVLLSHRDTVEEYSSWGYDLVLCGHGHGGIIRIPILDRGLISNDHTLLPKYDGGLYTIGDFTCCVSGGWAATPCRSLFSACSIAPTCPSSFCAPAPEGGRFPPSLFSAFHIAVTYREECYMQSFWPEPLILPSSARDTPALRPLWRQLGWAVVVCFTINLDAVGNMPATPPSAAPAKAIWCANWTPWAVKWPAADKACIQYRLLNRGKGPAVHSLRAQADRRRYQEVMKHTWSSRKG